MILVEAVVQLLHSKKVDLFLKYENQISQLNDIAIVLGHVEIIYLFMKF